MTEVEWLTGTELTPLLDFLKGKASARKLRLFACACYRRVWHLLTDEPTQQAVVATERYADGEMGEAELSEFWDRTSRFNAFHERVAPIPQRVRRRAWFQARQTAGTLALFASGLGPGVVGGPSWEENRGRMLAELRACTPLLRDIIGNPFQPVALDPRWSTADVLGLARTIYDERALDRLPILADALEDAGCANADLLGHLRGPAPHVRGCWAVDLLLSLV
jgi:hypothetical protein